VFERYQATQSLLYRSDYNGAIEMNFVSKRNIQIFSWRTQYKRYWQDSFEPLN
jgi:beta-lactamase superfamily II metal-dependent hydrolase